MLNLGEYKHHEAWSQYLAKTYGIAEAASFVIGSDILLDHVEEDMQALASKPRGTHIGEIGISFLEDLLPPQFLMRYDYDFLYALRTKINSLRTTAHLGNPIIAHSVLEELTLYLIVEESRFLMESIELNDESSDEYCDNQWDQWIFDIFDDMDLLTWLYSDIYLDNDNVYHFDHWLKRQFYC